MQPTVYSKADLACVLRRSNVLLVSRESGISYSTLLKLRDGGDVRASTAEKLSRYFQEGDATKKSPQEKGAREGLCHENGQQGEST